MKYRVTVVSSITLNLDSDDKGYYPKSIFSGVQKDDESVVRAMALFDAADPTLLFQEDVIAVNIEKIELDK